jgi:hypothetical protein
MIKRQSAFKQYIRLSACGALLIGLGMQPARATVLTFDDVTLADPTPVHSFPSVFQGPIGFADSGYQFSNNIVIVNINNIANGPAFSGSNAAFNTYDGYGYGPEFTITKVGGGLFSFSDVYIQSWSYSSHNPIVPGSGEVQGNILGYNNGTLVGFLSYANVLSWTDVSAYGSIGSFANITELVIAPVTAADNQNTLTLIDNLQLNSGTIGVPGPTAGAGLVPALGFGALAIWRRRRRQQSA